MRQSAVELVVQIAVASGRHAAFLVLFLDDFGQETVLIGDLLDVL